MHGNKLSEVETGCKQQSATFAKTTTRLKAIQNSNFCSDFRYESDGIFVLGWVFFSSDKFRLFN